MEEHGWAWVNKVHRKPICDVRDIKRGQHKGKVEVTLCRGRNGDGSIKRGQKLIVPISYVDGYEDLDRNKKRNKPQKKKRSVAKPQAKREGANA